MINFDATSRSRIRICSPAYTKPPFIAMPATSIRHETSTAAEQPASNVMCSQSLLQQQMLIQPHFTWMLEGVLPATEPT